MSFGIYMKISLCDTKNDNFNVENVRERYGEEHNLHLVAFLLIDNHFENFMTPAVQSELFDGLQITVLMNSKNQMRFLTKDS